MVCKEAMYASGTRISSCSVSAVHCVCVVVQHGLVARETWLPRSGPRLESQYGEPMALSVLKAGEHARHQMADFFQKLLQCGRDAEEMAFIIPS